MDWIKELGAIEETEGQAESKAVPLEQLAEEVSRGPAEESFDFSSIGAIEEADPSQTASPSMEQAGEESLPMQALQTAGDAGLGLLEGLGASFTDEAAGLVYAGALKTQGDPRDINDIRKEGRDRYRDMYKEAQERSPLTTFGTEMVGSVVGPVGKLAKGASLLKAGAAGAMTALGKSEAELIDEDPQIIDAGIEAVGGAALSAIPTAGVNFLKKMFPSVGRLTAIGLGSDTKGLARKGDKNTIEAAKALRDMKLLSSNAKGFDIKTKTFSKVKGGDNLGLEPDTILSNMEDAIEKLGQQNENLLKGKTITARKLLDKMEKDLMNTSVNFKQQGVLDVEGFQGKSDKMLRTVMKDLGIEDLDANLEAKQVERLKRVLQRKTALYEKLAAQGDPKVQDSDLITGTMATSIMEALEEIAPTAYRENNKMMAKVFTMKPYVEMTIARGDNLGRTPYSPRSFFAGMVDSITRGGALGKASVQEFAEGPMVAPLLKGAENTIKRSPVQLGGNLIQSPAGSDSGRIPQGNFNLPNELTNQKLPRDTQSLMKMNKLLLAKIAQDAPPQIFKLVEDALIGGEDSLSLIMPEVVKSLPQLFVKDPYNTYDGAFLDPAMAEKARTDIMDMEGLPMVEKIKRINQINKTGRMAQ